jgi:hypothetical protein
MDVRIAVETTFDKDAKLIHQLDGISRPYRVTCPEGFGRYLADGKWVFKQVQQAILCDQLRKSAVKAVKAATAQLVPRFAPSMTIAGASKTRFLAGLVQPRITDCAVVALDVGALLMLAELDMLDGSPMFLSPFHQLFADVFGAIVDPYPMIMPHYAKNLPKPQRFCHGVLCILSP